MSNIHEFPTDDRIVSEAALWFSRLSEAEGEKRRDIERGFQAWVAADPRHAEAFAAVSSAWDAVGDHAVSPEMVTLRHAALEDARDSARARWYSPGRFRQWGIAASVAVAIVGAAAVFILPQFAQGEVYATKIGERRAVTLSDNSRVNVDADSEISVEFTDDTRLVRLLRGQAYFEVEKDPGRAFIVEANDRRVVATGTAFNVELIDGEVRVTLVEGHVFVRPVAKSSSSPQQPAIAPAELSPGDQLTVSAAAPARIARPSNLATATSWRQGKLIFDDEPLGDALVRMRRYSRTEIVVADPALASLRVSGVFNAGDMTAFVGALETYFPIDIVRDGAGNIRLLRRKS